MMQEPQSWCSVITSWGGMGREVGRRSRGRGHMYTYGRSMWMYGRDHHKIAM